jgi:hypothetical protein
MKTAESAVRRALEAVEELADLGNLLALASAVRIARHNETNSNGSAAPAQEESLSKRVMKIAEETTKALKHVDTGAQAAAAADISARLQSLNAEIENLCASPFRHNNGKHPAYGPMSIARHLDRVEKELTELHGLLTQSL